MVFSRPLSAALLVALLLTEAGLPYVPLAVARLVILLSIVPVLRLLPRLLRSQLKWALVVLAGLVALDLVVSFLPAGSALQRLWTLIVARDRSGWMCLPDEVRHTVAVGQLGVGGGKRPVSVSVPPGSCSPLASSPVFRAGRCSPILSRTGHCSEHLSRRAASGGGVRIQRTGASHCRSTAPRPSVAHGDEPDGVS